MKKTLAIVSYSIESVNSYYAQIRSLFSESIQINKITIDDIEVSKDIQADTILIPSYDLFKKINRHIKDDTDLIFANRTISKSGIEKILDLEKGTEAVLIDESAEMTEQMISVIYQLGGRSVDLKSYWSLDDMADKTIIILGQSNYVPDSAKKIINIGNSLLDFNTIIDIGMKFNLMSVLNRRDIGASYRQVKTANFGLAEILGLSNSRESQLDILLEVIDAGVIAINPAGIIFLYNKHAENILDLKGDKVINKNAINLFDQIPFKQVLKGHEVVEDKIIQIKGENIIVSINPLLHSKKLYGAVAIIRKYKDTENKQIKIRQKLIGKGHIAKYNFDDIIGKSYAINKCKEIAKRMAKSDSSVLITGETGTGKELFAQAIHNISLRKNQQFTAVNCGALPEGLLESELFGYEDGAFTGARKGGKQGLFELAHGGTLFLDEIAEMPMDLQVKLLRVVQEREVVRLGGDEIINIDIRIIATTNRDLKGMVKKGEFRKDLYYRLNVLPLRIPPLRDRKDDIFHLLQAFKKQFKSDFLLSQEARQLLLAHSWDGNVRELRNYAEYFINLGSKEIKASDLPFENIGDVNDENTIHEENQMLISFLEISGNDIRKYLYVLEELEQAYINNSRLGRRSIHKLVRLKGIFLSEQEIRSILVELDKIFMVRVSKGRTGTVITKEGIKILDYLRMG